jgi:hypothetical protein
MKRRQGSIVRGGTRRPIACSRMKMPGPFVLKPRSIRAQLTSGTGVAYMFDARRNDWKTLIT